MVVVILIDRRVAIRTDVVVVVEAIAIATVIMGLWGRREALLFHFLHASATTPLLKKTCVSGLAHACASAHRAPTVAGHVSGNALAVEECAEYPCTSVSFIDLLLSLPHSLPLALSPHLPLCLSLPLSFPPLASLRILWAVCMQLSAWFQYCCPRAEAKLCRPRAGHGRPEPATSTRSRCLPPQRRKPPMPHQQQRQGQTANNQQPTTNNQ